MGNKRTDVDFSSHELIERRVGGVDGVRLTHTLKHPDYEKQYKINFINADGVLVVTGDYGNWIFCREFHPSAEGSVSGGYWMEKLEMYSTQQGTEYNSELTEKEIEEGINGGLEEYGYTGDKLEKAVEYFKELLYYVEENDFNYCAYAFPNKPSFMDYDEVPYVKTTKHRLSIVFDAFEEICKRYRDGIQES